MFQIQVSFQETDTSQVLDSLTASAFTEQRNINKEMTNNRISVLQ